MIIDELKPLADAVLRRPRLSREDLMGILSKCYRRGLSPLSPTDRQLLMAAISGVRRSEGASRAYVRSGGASAFQLILRYVFPSVSERNNVSRYSAVLGFLAAEGVKPAMLEYEVNQRGGLASLYWEARERETKVMRRAKLNLDRTIQATHGTPIVLRLMPTARGIFTVLSCENDHEGT